MNTEPHFTREAAQAMTPADYAQLREAYYKASEGLIGLLDMAESVGNIDRDNIRQLNAVFDRLGALAENL